jgi:hypothetical protein
MIPPKLPDWLIHWVDGKREPKHPPDRAYPTGLDIDLSMGRKPACMSPLPYPAPRCGHYVIECRACGANVVLTTAGRVDDPKSLKMACRQAPAVEVGVAERLADEWMHDIRRRVEERDRITDREVH